MMTKVWKTKKGYDKGARLEEHVFRNGEKHYSFRDRLGRPADVSSNEVCRLIRMYSMEDVTEEMRLAGWIK